MHGIPGNTIVDLLLLAQKKEHGNLLQSIHTECHLYTTL